MYKRTPFSASPPRILSVAGSDPSGGAGVQADIKTFTSLGCYGMAVLTALTAQNTQGVRSVHYAPTDFVHAQLQALWDDVEVDAIKIGMLGKQDIVQTVSQELKDARLRNVPVVLDPVMVSTSGSMLLTDESIIDVVNLLLPQCTLLTPNVPEAKHLLKHGGRAASPIGCLLDMLQAAEAISCLGAKAVLLKGGHTPATVGDVNRQLDQLAIYKVGKAKFGEQFLDAVVYEGTWRSYNVIVVRDDEGAMVEKLQSDVSTKMLITDVLYERHGNQFTVFIKPFVHSTATHGTGCTLSSALASHLATPQKTNSLSKAVYDSIQYVHQAINHGLDDFGKGDGPLNHFCNIIPRSTPASFVKAHPE